MADFVETISSVSTSTIITRQMGVLWDTSSLPVKVAGIVFALMYSSWGIFYDSKAKHWAINCPGYVVAGYREVIDAVKGGPGGRPGRVVFRSHSRVSRQGNKESGLSRRSDLRRGRGRGDALVGAELAKGDQ